LFLGLIPIIGGGRDPISLHY
jgi:hypothetical protein